MSWLNKVIPPDTVCKVLSTEERYQKQRDRVAAITHEGFTYYDRFQAARPYLFYGGISLSAVAAFMWYWRGIRKGARVAEAHAVYPTLMAVGAASAFIGRPASDAKPRPTDPGQNGFITWVDDRVKTLRSEDPYFADAVFERVQDAIPGVWSETPEIARTFVTCGRRK
ncbi:MAG: hypothetical protein F6K48_02970 [Okeania sp. SIO3H1]|nr:hypothetical protein [Okeania sp. SIO3H1]